MFETFCNKIIPNNRFEFLPTEEIEEIVIGSTNRHIFILPFDCTVETKDLQIIYKQGFDVILGKLKGHCEIEKLPCHKSKVILTLLPEETLEFKINWLETFVQIKVIDLVTDEVFYTEPKKLKVLKPLDQ